MAWAEAGKAGALLGVLVIGLQLVATATGGTAWFPIVATLLELVVLVALLRRTRDGSGYGAQVAHGLVATLVSLPLVAVGFLLAVLVLFPDALPAAADATRARLEARGADAAEIEAAIAALGPVPQGLAGLLGTLVTGLVVSVVAAVFLRDRPNPAAHRASAVG